MSLNCLKCHHPMLPHRNAHCDLYFWCISRHRNNEEYYYCDKCQYFYFCCPKCSNEENKVMCQFLGFTGRFLRDASLYKYRVLDKSKISVILKKIPILEKYLKNDILEFTTDDLETEFAEYSKKFIEEMDMILEMQYDVSDKKLVYFDTQKCYKSENDPYIMEPMFHRWRCQNCETIFSDNNFLDWCGTSRRK